MPLKNGCDRKTIAANIRELRGKGHSHAQSVAIALDHARQQGCKGYSR